jgi:hypothetical protein
LRWPAEEDFEFGKDWRRRHQARSHWYHQRTRLARRIEIALVS